MPENSSKEDLINKIIGSYQRHLEDYLAPLARQNATATNVLKEGLIKGLDEILRRELPEEQTPTEQQQLVGLDYNPIIGPITKDGRRYTTEQILEMPINTFIDLHRSSSTIRVSRYIRAIAYEIESRREGRIGLGIGPNGVKIKAVVEFPLEEAVRLTNIRERVIQSANDYFQNSYRITLGAKLG